MLGFLNIRDLQKISGETIRALDGPTPLKAGERTIGVLVPLRVADAEKLAAVLKKAEALARRRNRAEDDAFLAEFGAVDAVTWSVEAVRALQSEER